MPTLVLAEGLLVYLDVEPMVGLLGGVRRPGGARAAPWRPAWPSTPTGSTRPGVVERANAARPGAGAEPWRTILPVPAHLALVERARDGRWSKSLDDVTFDAGAVRGPSLLVVGPTRSG